MNDILGNLSNWSLELWQSLSGWTIGIGILLILFLLWFLWISRGTNDADPNTLEYRLHRAWRRIAFWAGDVRSLPKFPWIQTGKRKAQVGHEELFDAEKKAAPCDVMLTRSKGYFLSNSAIPGLFKHATFFVRGPKLDGILADITEARIVEAVSEGVLKHHPQYTRADYMILLRPKHMTNDDKIRAVKNANKIVGCKYDADFQFNIEDELHHVGKDTRTIDFQADADELQRVSQNFRAEFDMAFSCTEVVAFALWHVRRKLGISRQKSRGRLVITADQFVNRDFEIIWTNVTPEIAAKAGLSEEGVREIEAYHKANS